jgi:uncharacterized protein with NRDE domain
MCISVFAWRAHAAFPLVIAANRDERHDRAAVPLERWERLHPFFAGRDVSSGGTWFGIDEGGRFALLTNCVDANHSDAPLSRGGLVPSFLAASSRPNDFLGELALRARDYAAFNLVIADEYGLWYASNRVRQFARPLAPGIYGLGNHPLGTTSPKLVRLRGRFEEWLRVSTDGAVDTLFEMLADEEPGSTDERDSSPTLPPDLRQALSAPFVRHPSFGTRCSTVVLIARTGSIVVAERSFDACGGISGEVSLRLDRSPTARVG